VNRSVAKLIAEMGTAIINNRLWHAGGKDLSEGPQHKSTSDYVSTPSLHRNLSTGLNERQKFFLLVKELSHCTSHEFRLVNKSVR
jgi:hypothetical protein